MRSFLYLYLRDIIETIISLVVLFPFVLCILFPLLFFAFLLRIIVFVYINLKYSGSVQLMSLEDGAWACETAASTNNCHGIYIIEGKCDMEKVRKLATKMVETKVSAGRLKRRISTFFGIPCWVEEDFDLEKHIQVFEDEEQGGITEEDLFRFLAEEDKPIRDVPPWKVYVFPVFKYPCRTDTETNTKHYAMIYKISHALMDGISTGNFAHSAIADKPFRFIFDPSEIKGPPFFQKGIILLAALLSFPRAMVRSNLCKDRSWRGKPPLELKGPKTFTWSRPLNIEALKVIKKKTNTSMFTVLENSVAGSLKSLENVAERFHIMATLIIPPYPKNRTPCNRVSGVLAPAIAGSVNTTVRQRLQQNHTNLMDDGRFSSIILAYSNSFCCKLVGALPLWFHRVLNRPLHLAFAMSNVPGPSENVWIHDGDKIVDMGIWIPIKFCVGLGVCAFSYKDRMRVSFVGDATYFPNKGEIHKITKAFEDDLVALAKEVGVDGIFHVS